MKPLDYWKECISNAAEEIKLALTSDQLTAIAESVEGGHDNYGMAFYSPPSSDRFNEIEREHEKKIKRLEKEMEQYLHDAEIAVKKALRVRPDSNISIGKQGEVMLLGGRIERIQ